MGEIVFMNRKEIIWSRCDIK